VGAATVTALVLSSVAAVTGVVSLVLNFHEGSRRDEEIRLLRGPDLWPLEKRRGATGIASSTTSS